MYQRTFLSRAFFMSVNLEYFFKNYIDMVGKMVYNIKHINHIGLVGIRMEVLAMKISTKGRYGLRALVDMAANTNGEPVSLTQTAGRQNLSLNYLEQVFGTLRKAGIVASVKGAGGGYMLAKDASEITVKEILEALEGEFSIVNRITDECEDEVEAAIRELVWDEIDRRVNELFQECTLGRLVDDYREKQGQFVPMYYL